jgi:glycosyltransferase involved in cell wall biosynthesis
MELNTICFGGEDWWYHNRGHVDMQLTRNLARRGRTLYVNSVVMQTPSILSDKAFGKKVARKVGSILAGVRESGEGFWVYSPISLPLHHLRAGRWMNSCVLRAQMVAMERKLGLQNVLLVVHCPAACHVALAMKRSKLVYLRTDRYEDYPNVNASAISAYDTTLKQHADLTVFANRSLYLREALSCRKAIYLDHGVDYEHFAHVDSRMVPPEMVHLPRPIIGFFGAIDGHTFDLQLISDVVALLPEMSFVFVGKSSIDCKELAARPNVLMVGRMPYDLIPRYGTGFDVAIMPWRRNSWIEACNPIKLKEYLALGKPIVSTPFPELRQYGRLVYQAVGPEQFAMAIRRAIAQDDASLVAERKARVRQESWESKTQSILDELFGCADDDSHSCKEL